MHFFGAIWENLYSIWYKFSIIIQVIEAGTAPFNDAILDKVKKTHYIWCPISTFFFFKYSTDLMHILVGPLDGRARVNDN